MAPQSIFLEAQDDPQKRSQNGVSWNYFFGLPRRGNAFKMYTKRPPTWGRFWGGSWGSKKMLSGGLGPPRPPPKWSPTWTSKKINDGVQVGAQLGTLLGGQDEKSCFFSGGDQPRAGHGQAAPDPPLFSIFKEPKTEPKHRAQRSKRTPRHAMRASAVADNS